LKSKRSQNALTHGLYAREAVLPWESADAFAAYYRAIRDDLDPEGPLEEEAVREVAELHWRKQRLAMGYLLQYYKDTPPPELIKAAKGGLGSLAAHLASAAAPSVGATIVATGSQILDYIKSGCRTELPAATPAGATVVRSVVEQAYDPAAMERMLRVEAMIDGRIAKVMGRLVNLKEYKRIYGTRPATVLPSASAPALSPAASPGAEPSAPVPSTNPLKWGDPG
jgi:hypothetical protein